MGVKRCLNHSAKRHVDTNTFSRRWSRNHQLYLAKTEVRKTDLVTSRGVWYWLRVLPRPRTENMDAGVYAVKDGLR